MFLTSMMSLAVKWLRAKLSSPAKLWCTLLLWATSPRLVGLLPFVTAFTVDSERL